MSKEKVQSTIDELNSLEKSENQLEDDGIAALEKALADFDFDDLSKSDDDEDDKDEKDGKDDDDEDDDDKDGEGDKDDDDEDVKKSIDESELEQELVKASEAYAELEESVNALSKSHGEQFDEVRSALASLTSLTMAVGKGVLALNKSVGEFGGQPISSGRKPLLGDGHGKVKTELSKSRSEVTALIKSACEEGKLPWTWLSKVSVNGVDCINDDVKAIIGL